MEQYMLPCLWLKYTGMPCPGCGGQRAVLYLMRGHFLDALKMYPGIYPLIIFVGLIVFNKISPFRIYPKTVSLFGLATVFTVLLNYIFELNHLFHFLS